MILRHLNAWLSQAPFTLVRALVFVFPFPYSLLAVPLLLALLHHSDPLGSPFPRPTTSLPPAPPTFLMPALTSSWSSHLLSPHLLIFSPPFPVLSCPLQSNPHTCPHPYTCPSLVSLAEMSCPPTS
jgi:hypothetical protein